MSATKRQSIADIGHPCRIPVFISNIVEIHPLFFSIKIGFLYKSLIKFKKSFPKLNFSRVLNKIKDLIYNTLYD